MGVICIDQLKLPRLPKALKISAAALNSRSLPEGGGLGVCEIYGEA